MKTQNICEILKKNRYPGRGIAVGLTEDGSRAVFVYFIMGRSLNSRNRMFVEENDALKTVPFDPAKVEDPSLILYSPVKCVGKDTIVTNGDQTDTIEQALRAGHCFRHGLMGRTFEPDAPNFTPRISAILHTAGRFSYEMSILKSADEKGSACDRFFFAYEPVKGVGHFLHTYEGDATPLPPFSGEPERIYVPNDFKAFGEEIWNALDAENKISLYLRAIDLRGGTYEKIIFNKYTR